MMPMSRKKKKITTLIPFREIAVLALSVCSLFLMAAFYSYRPHDPSWCYVTSEEGVVSNWCGPVGAHFISFLFYLLGSAALLWIPLSIWVPYVVLKGSSLKNEWDRILGWSAFILFSAAWCHAYSCMIVAHSSTGGLIGKMIYDASVAWFEVLGTRLLISLLVLTSFIFVTRWSFFAALSFLFRAVRKTYIFCRRHRVMTKGMRAVYTASKMIMIPFSRALHFGKKMLDGSAFMGTGLIGDQPLSERSSLIQPARAAIIEPISSENEIEIPRAVAPIVKEELYHHDVPQEHRETEVGRKEYTLPSLDIFVGVAEEKDDPAVIQELEKRAGILEEKLERFGVQGRVTGIKRGPVVTLFEYKPDIDTKLSKIIALEDDLAMALKAVSIRILAPIPGKSLVGFEVANSKRKDVLLGAVINSAAYREHGGTLPLILGEDTVGNTVIVDLVRMPHLLMAGSTGSGKSVALNTVLMSMLCKKTPDEVQLILIDPKRLEFAAYADIAHLIFPIVTDPRKAAPVLRWVVSEMESRYERMAQAGARSITDYNERVATSDEKLPFIVVVIDELADLMMTAGRDVEDLIARIAQMARAAGIHLIVATQRPSVDVITGLIKVNFPSRISFRVTSKVDSRTILDCGGAEKLLGRGDMLFLDSTRSVLQRVHGAYVSDEEIAHTVSHIRAERPVHYLDLTHEITTQEKGIDAQDEELYMQVCSFVAECDEISISLLQRKFRIGYNRSARMIDILEERGKILPADGGKMRKVVR